MDKYIYLGVQAQHKGLVERRLESYGELLGLCFRAEHRLKFQGLLGGRQVSDQELGVLIGQIQRRLSQVVMSAQLECLMGKFHQVGPGNAQLAL